MSSSLSGWTQSLERQRYPHPDDSVMMLIDLQAVRKLGTTPTPDARRIL